MPETSQMDRNLALEAVRVTEAAALSASRWMGRGDEKAADITRVQRDDSQEAQVEFVSRSFVRHSDPSRRRAIPAA